MVLLMPKGSGNSERRRVPRGPLPSPEEIAKRKAESAELRARCEVVFEKLRPQLIGQYYNWFIAIDPDSEEYLIAPSFLEIFEKVRDSNLRGKGTIIRLNETGVCGYI